MNNIFDFKRNTTVRFGHQSGHIGYGHGQAPLPPKTLVKTINPSSHPIHFFYDIDRISYSVTLKITIFRCTVGRLGEEEEEANQNMYIGTKWKTLGRNLRRNTDKKIHVPTKIMMENNLKTLEKQNTCASNLFGWKRYVICGMCFAEKCCRKKVKKINKYASTCFYHVVR